MGQDTQNREIRAKLTRWAANKSPAVNGRAGYIIGLLERAECGEDVRRQLSQNIHILEWQLAHPNGA